MRRSFASRFAQRSLGHTRPCLWRRCVDYHAVVGHLDIKGLEKVAEFFVQGHAIVGKVVGDDFCARGQCAKLLQAVPHADRGHGTEVVLVMVRVLVQIGAFQNCHIDFELADLFPGLVRPPARVVANENCVSVVLEDVVECRLIWSGVVGFQGGDGQLASGDMVPRADQLGFQFQLFERKGLFPIDSLEHVCVSVEF